MPKASKSRETRGALNRFEAANYISVSPRTLDNLLSAGVIPKGKSGRKTLVRVKDLDKYLEQILEVK